MVRAFAHGAMGRQIDPSWGGPISCVSQCSTTGVTKAVVSAILSVGMVHIKESLLLIGKSSPCDDSGFLSRYPSGPLPYVRHHIIVNTMC